MSLVSTVIHTVLAVEHFSEQSRNIQCLIHLWFHCTGYTNKVDVGIKPVLSYDNDMFLEY